MMMLSILKINVELELNIITKIKKIKIQMNSNA